MTSAVVTDSENLTIKIDIPANIRNREWFLASILIRSASKRAYALSARNDNSKAERQACWDAGRLLYALAEFLKECSF